MTNTHTTDAIPSIRLWADTIWADTIVAVHELVYLDTLMVNCHVSLKLHGSTGQMCSSLLKFLAQIDKVEIAESASKDNIAKQRLIQLFQLWETFIQGLLKEAIEGVFNNVLYSDLSPGLYNEWVVPRFLQCGGYANHIEIVLLWFSSGGTKSVLHTDTQENLHCLVSGTK